MAYDPKDAADKKIVDDLIAKAIERAIKDVAEDDDHEAHVAVVKGLKDKNNDLVGRLKKAKENGNDPAELSKLENEVEKLQTENKELGKQVKAVSKERDMHKMAFDAETAASRKLLVEQGLTEALVRNGVSNNFLAGAKALLQGQVTIKAEGENRLAMVGDKALGDFVKDWSQGDEGKNYVTAANNSGGNAPGGTANGGASKTLTRTAFDAMPPAARMAFSKESGTVVDG